MNKLDERGSLLVPLAVVSALLLFSLIFGTWAFAGRQEYKNNVDAKIAEAVAATEETVALRKDAEFAEASKLPYRTYQGPSTYGSLNISYPKNWSSYIDESGRGNTPVSGYGHPDFVPSTSVRENNFALRFEVQNTAYDAAVKSFDSSVRSGSVRASAYRAPKVDSVLGMRLEGEIESRKQGVMVLLPLRDKTIKIWTEGQDYRTDFAKILEEFSFTP